jgi:hypothetical protein
VVGCVGGGVVVVTYSVCVGGMDMNGDIDDGAMLLRAVKQRRARERARFVEEMVAFGEAARGMGATDWAAAGEGEVNVAMSEMLEHLDGWLEAAAWAWWRERKVRETQGWDGDWGRR